MRLIKEFHFYDELLSLQEAFSSKKAKDWRERIKKLCDEEGGDYEAACRALNIPLGGPEGLSEDIRDRLDACCERYDSDWFYQDGVINTKGSFSLKKNLLTEDGVLIPEITFGICSGSFDASYLNLRSLERFPTEVVEDFDISGNPNLTSLEGCPESVKNFKANACGLTSLNGCPSSVQGKFDVSYNTSLGSLEGTENCDVRGGISVRNCGLETLEGGFSNYNPTETWVEFDCQGNNLKTLIGAPRSSRGYNVDCSFNPNLYSIEGIPMKSGKNLQAKGCLLPQRSLVELFKNAIKFESWVAAYFYLIATPQFQRMSKAQRDPIRARISPQELKSKAFALSSIWNDPIMKEKPVIRLMKKIQLSDEEKEGIDALTGLSDLGIF